MKRLLRGVGLSSAVLLAVPGCRSPMHAAMAAANVAIGATAAGIRRSQGQCYTGCEKGTRCNPSTGFCEPQPCWDMCKRGEECDETGPVPKCIPVVHDDDLLIQKVEEGPE